MKQFKFLLRITPLILALLVFLLGAMARLYNLQVTHGDDNMRQTERRVVRTVTLPAARGEILDRYGRPLVVNRISYGLRIDRDRLLGSQDPDDTLDRLTRLMDAQDVVYEDQFPVTAPPFRYREDLDEQTKKRLDRFLKEQNWEASTDAPTLMTKLRELFDIRDTYDDKTARRIVGIRYELELRKLFFNIPPYQFAQDIDMKMVEMVCEQDFPGVLVDTLPVREYRTQFAAHLLGRVGQIPEGQAEDYKAKGYAADEIVGLDGMEYGLESWLRGKNGKRTEETTAAGKVTGILSATPPEPGKNCLLTIDLRLQERTEHALEAGVLALRERGVKERLDEKELAGGGAAVIMNVKTAEVLAMASYPTFDLAKFQENFAVLRTDPTTPMLNRAIAGTYEPGSTFKMNTALAALEAGTITPRSTIFDYYRYMYYAPSYTPSCNGHHGSVNVGRALQVSCNYFFYDVGRRTGIEEMNRISRQLGFGAVTGVELPGERAGILAGPEYCKEHDIRWNPGDVLQAAIGQSYNQFTPLQMCNYVATLADGGVRHRPHLLSAVKSFAYDGTVFEPQPEIQETLVLKEDTLEAVLSGMRRVAQPGGTAAATFGNYPVPVGAKTGSAQKKADGSPANGVFVAFAPFDNPEVAVVVVVERGGAGSRVAPIAKDIFDAYFQGRADMNKIPPENQLHG